MTTTAPETTPAPADTDQLAHYFRRWPMSVCGLNLRKRLPSTPPPEQRCAVCVGLIRHD